ncbi:MAG: recombinase family protein [Dehalococcoidia bacterium]
MPGKAVGYFREDSGAGAPTIAEQNRMFLEYCRIERLEVADTFVEPKHQTAERPAFRQLVDFLRASPAEVTVVVSSIERLGKDMREAARASFQLLSLGARIVTISGESDATASLVEGWRSREGSERLGERVRAAMRRKAVKGEALGRPPYGYKVGLRHRLEPIPDEAALVRYIFRLYTQEGLGIRLIARRLNEEGHRTRRDGNWSMVTIRDILRNRVYLGTYSRFGVRVPGSHTALISPEDHRKAQDKMAARRTAGGPRNVNPYLLAGLAYCGSCGNRMIGVTRRQSWQRRSDGGTSSAEYRYYQCGSRTNQSVCDYHTRSATQLDDEVRLATAAALERLVQGEAPETGSGNRLDDPKRLQTRLRQLDRRLEQYLDHASSGRISPDRLRALSIELGQQQLEVEDELAEINRRARERDARTERLHVHTEQIVKLRDGWDDLEFAERQALLRDVLQRVNVTDDAVEVILSR